MATISYHHILSRPTTAPPVYAVESEPNYFAIYVSSILAVSALFLVGVGLPMALYLDDWVAGLGLGAFSAFWGGPSFGTMAGAARVSAWQERYGTDDPLR